MEIKTLLGNKVFRLRGKLLTAFLLAAVLPFIVLSIASVKLSVTALKKKTTNKLVSDLRIKKDGLNSYLRDMRINIGLQGGRNAGTGEALKTFSTIGMDEFTYKMYDNQYGQHFQPFLNAFDGATTTILAASVAKKDHKIIGKIVYVTSVKKVQDGKEKSKAETYQNEKDKLVKGLGSQYLLEKDQNPISKAYYLALKKEGPVILDFTSLRQGSVPSLWMAAPIQIQEGTKQALPIDAEEDGVDG